MLCTPAPFETLLAKSFSSRLEEVSGSYIPIDLGLWHGTTLSAYTMQVKD